MWKALTIIAIMALTCTPVLAERLTAIINKTDQTLVVMVGDQAIYQWDVSTGKKNSWTPSGTFGVESMDADHYSSLYGNAPMPWSIFFNGNIAVHGTTQVAKLGTPDSHGCVRLHPDNAKVLFQLVKTHGRASTTIVVQN